MTTLFQFLAILFLGLSVADLMQTLKLQKLGAVENNPLLGKRPKPAKLIIFAAGSTAVWLGLAVLLHVKGAPKVEAVLALGCFLRLWVVSKGYKLGKELAKDKP